MYQKFILLNMVNKIIVAIIDVLSEDITFFSAHVLRRIRLCSADESIPRKNLFSSVREAFDYVTGSVSTSLEQQHETDDS